MLTRFFSGVFAILFLGSFAIHDGGSNRTLSSASFPRIENTSDIDDINASFPAYLEFVTAIGRQGDKKTADRLQATYSRLRARDKVGSARFLRGLRFELLQKLELLGLSEESVTTNHPAFRKWVAKYLPVWLRECDEYLFRSYTASLTRR